jgi:hypothetical protein
METKSKPDWSWPATRRWLRVRVPRRSSSAVKLRAGRCCVVVLVAALASAEWERWAGVTGPAAGRFSSVNVSGAHGVVVPAEPDETMDYVREVLKSHRNWASASQPRYSSTPPSCGESCCPRRWRRAELVDARHAPPHPGTSRQHDQQRPATDSDRALKTRSVRLPRLSARRLVPQRLGSDSRRPAQALRPPRPVETCATTVTPTDQVTRTDQTRIEAGSWRSLSRSTAHQQAWSKCPEHHGQIKQIRSSPFDRPPCR